MLVRLVVAALDQMYGSLSWTKTLFLGLQQISHRSERSIEEVGTSGGEEMTSQRRGGAGGSQTDPQTDPGRESVVEETDTGNGRRSPPSKLRGSSTTSGAGKTASSAKRTRSRRLEIQMSLLPRRRNPTLNCRGL